MKAERKGERERVLECDGVCSLYTEHVLRGKHVPESLWHMFGHLFEYLSHCEPSIPYSCGPTNGEHKWWALTPFIFAACPCVLFNLLSWADLNSEHWTLWIVLYWAVLYRFSAYHGMQCIALICDQPDLNTPLSVISIQQGYHSRIHLFVHSMTFPSFIWNLTHILNDQLFNFMNALFSYTISCFHQHIH